MQGEGTTQVTGGFLFNGYFNGEAICMGMNKLTYEEYAYRNGIEYEVIGVVSVTTDESGVVSGLPNCITKVAKDSITLVLGYQASTGVRGICMLNPLSKIMYATDGSVMANWSGQLSLDTTIRNYWR